MNPLVKLIEKITFRGLEAFGRYYSVYPAQVVSSDDKDNQQALYLHIPVIHGIKANTRVLPYNVFSGKNYGIQMLPKIGDMVYVTFLYGDPNHPRWVHGWYAKNELPEKFKNKQAYGFISPAKNEVIIDDKEGKVTVTLANGNFVEINKDQITLQIKDGKKVEVLKDIVKINGDVNQGLVNVKPLEQQLTILDSNIKTLAALTNTAISVYSAILDSGASATAFATAISNLPPIDTSNLENKNVKHG